MAIGNQLGNQVYSFNHEEFDRLTQLENVSNNSNEIFVFPNPASDYLYIRNELKPEITSYDYTIINTIGETVQTGTLQNENRIRIDHICSGMYFIIFNLNNSPRVSAFMKQ
ncbi:MAG: T9SS type A sorting domain-containing protein [Saprospiraceae bacterium]|nr:T9SS type A sorting domain-containing protein [Saprospiraceae bacterium]